MMYDEGILVSIFLKLTKLLSLFLKKMKRKRADFPHDGP